MFWLIKEIAFHWYAEFYAYVCCCILHIGKLTARIMRVRVRPSFIPVDKHGLLYVIDTRNDHNEYFD